MIPDFDEQGYLPVGIHWTTWEELVTRFGTTSKRLRLLKGLKSGMEQLKTSNCPIVYINGSFITAKLNPGDFDVCWDSNGVDFDTLQRLAPLLYNARETSRQKNKYGGEFFREDLPANIEGMTYLDFFQIDTNTNLRKGIIAIDLMEFNHD